MISPPHCTHSFSDTLLTKTFPLLVAIFAAWIVPQCGAVMAGDRLAAIFTVAFYLSIRTLPSPLTESPYCALLLESRNGGLVIGYVVAIAILFLASRQFSIDRRPKPKNG